MGEIGVAVAGVDHDEQVVAGIADDQVVEDATVRGGQLGIARAAGRETLQVGGHETLEGRGGARTVEADLAHVRDVEQGGGGAAVLVLGEDARRILDRQFPAREIDHSATELAVEIVQRRPLRLAHGTGTPPRLGRATSARPVLPPSLSNLRVFDHRLAAAAVRHGRTHSPGARTRGPFA